jgi:hypothetical protein
MAFVNIAFGFGYARFSEAMMFLNLVPPRESSYYEGQAEVALAFICRAFESCQVCRLQSNHLFGIRPNVSFDGGWDHNRNGNSCFGAIIDVGIKKVLDFEVAITRDETGEVVRSAQVLEHAAFQLIATRWPEGFASVTHDKDLKLTKWLATHGVEERYDRNHVIKRFDPLWEAHAKVKDPNATRARTVLPPAVHVSLKRWFQHCARQPDVDARLLKWRGALAHETAAENADLWRTGKSKGSNGPSEEQVTHLRQFIEQACALLERVQHESSSQANECLNSMRTKQEGKDIAWKNSWDARMAVAVLRHNEGHSWILPMFDELSKHYGWAPLARRVRERLTALYAQKDRKRAARAADASRAKADNCQRWARKHRARTAAWRAVRGRDADKVYGADRLCGLDAGDVSIVGEKALGAVLRAMLQTPIGDALVSELYYKRDIKELISVPIMFR